MSHQNLITDNELQEIKNRALQNRVGKAQSHSKNCKCCASPVIAEPLSVGCEVQQFAHIGLLYPLYFRFIMYMGAYLGLASLFSLVNVHLNSQGSSCLTSSTSCVTSITNIISAEDSQDDIDLQTINNYLFIGASVLYLEIMCSVLKKKCRIMKERKDMESDYGVILKGVKSSKPTDVFNEIRHLQARYLAATNKPNKILRFAKLSDMKAFSQKQQLMITHPQLSVMCDHPIPFPQIQSMGYISDTPLQSSSPVIQSSPPLTHSTLISTLQSKSNFAGKVIVFFEYPVKLSEVQGTDLEHLTDPSDIIWENIGREKEENKSVWLLVGTGVLMFIAFLTILALKLWIKRLSENSHVATSTMLNLLVATVVAIFNSIEGILIRACARRELYGTHSRFFRIVARRLSYIFFINMVMTTFFSNLVIFLWGNDEDTDKVLPMNYDGLVRDFFFLFITNSYISSIFNYFDLFYGAKLLRRYKLEKYRKRNKYSNEEINFIFEGHPVDMGLRYGNIMKTLFFTAFISPFVPLGTVFSAIGLFICYWVDKYLLLNRYVCRHQLSPNFAKQMSEFSKFYVVLYAFSNMLLQIIPLNKDDQIQPSNLGLFISIGVFVGTLIYKFVLSTAKKIVFKKIRGGRCIEDKKYDKVKDRFRNRFEEKLNIYNVDNLIAEENYGNQQIDQKLLNTVRISTIQRVIQEEY